MAIAFHVSVSSRDLGLEFGGMDQSLTSSSIGKITNVTTAAALYGIARNATDLSS